MSDHDDAVQIVRALIRIACRRARDANGEDRSKLAAEIASVLCGSLGLDRQRVATEAGWGQAEPGVVQ